MRSVLVLCMFLSACGYSSRDNEMIGQVKKVMRNTPIICPDYYDADISLGVIRGGVGSMSLQDVWVVVKNDSDRELLQKANESGELVKVKYDVERFVFCTSDHKVTKAELVK